MEPVPRSRFDLHVVRTADTGAPLSGILLDGGPTGVTVAGAVLEAAFTCYGFYLVFVTDDIVHEETLRIYLLDDALNVVDWATLGAAYSTGAFAALRVLGSDAVEFSFFGGTRWRLSVRPDGVTMPPFLFDPRGVRRPLRFRRWLLLSGAPRVALE